MGSIDVTMILEPLQFLLPHREPVEALPTDTELTLPEESEEAVRDSEKTEQLEEVEGRKEGEMAHEEFSLE